MQKIIDFHTHAFTDEIADRAIRSLEEAGGIKAFLDGTVTDLLASMDRCGIEASVVCPIATKPSQFESILGWCRHIQSGRIIPFPSLHPDDGNAVERVGRIRGEGFKGIKLHPYYQDFSLTEARLYPIYEAIAAEGLILVVHTGYDLAFPRDRRADPLAVLKVKTDFPSLKLVATHLGAWDLWQEVARHLAGKEIYMELSFSLETLGRDEARTIILAHPKDHILFGSDSPWCGQGETLGLLRTLGLGEELERLILHDNALKLLQSVK